MKFNVVLRSVLIAGCLAALRISADPVEVVLWPGETPADTGIEGEEKSRVYQSPLVAPTKLITNIRQPTLTIHRPPKEKNTGAAVLICPGGGYWELFWELEGVEVAEWLNSIGVTGIILKYRVPRRAGEPENAPPAGPQLDAQRAMSVIRSRAREWEIDPARIGIIGFSAGGHLAFATATNFKQRLYARIDAADDVSSRPDFAILCYPGYLKTKDKDELWPGLQVPADAPPVMLVHASDDSISSSEHSVMAYLALKRAGVPAELHVFATGEHDFGVRQNEKPPSRWPQLCVSWLRSHQVFKTEK